MGSQALISFSNHIKDIKFIQITAGCDWDLLVCFRFGSLEGGGGGENDKSNKHG
jgi:hypothetical protein